jgi:FRG domain
MLVFRGLGDSSWSLTTTLERYTDAVELPFSDYYREIGTAQPQVETFTGEHWDIDAYPVIAAMGGEYDKFHLHLWGGQLKAYGFMAYPRHHGFPSPLLDWTRSPYIAAFFAFRSSAKPASDKVSVFVYCEKPAGMKVDSSGVPKIFRFGPYVRTHRRHFLQQGEYTMCLQWELNQPWRFVSHEKVFAMNQPGQDLLWKFNVPWSERVNVLKLLDDHNINAFSLFEDHDALLETLALRRFICEQRAS